jgi:hypothetical protein
MILEPTEPEASAAELQRRVDGIVAQGPGGTFAVAGVAVALVLALWLAFYLFVFVARGGA